MLWGFEVNAQTEEQPQTRRFEVELGLGGTFGFSHLNFDRNYGGIVILLEPRYKLRSVPVTVGVQFSGANFKREAFGIKVEPLMFSSWNVMAVSDYVWRRDKKFSLFAGLGLGLASVRTSAPITFDTAAPYLGYFTGEDDKKTFCVMPRVGVRYGRLRLTCAYMVEEKTNNHFRGTLGFVFGGGRKKQ